MNKSARSFNRWRNKSTSTGKKNSSEHLMQMGNISIGKNLGFGNFKLRTKTY